MKRQHGFGVLMAIVVVVILATLAAALVKFGSAQQLASAQDVLAARAWVAARSGSEWGLYQAVRNGKCGDATVFPATLDLAAETGFRVTVACSVFTYNEGELAPGTARQVRIYRIEATACNAPGSCPNAALATSAGYVERVRQVIAAD